MSKKYKRAIPRYRKGDIAMSKKYKKILGKNIYLTEAKIHINELKFFIENPRIYSAVRRKTNNPSPTQEQIFQILKDESNVRDLIRRIEHQGSVLEPLLVKKGTYEVLEGNSRLAACKLLEEKYKKKTTKESKEFLMEVTMLSCELVPEDTEENIIFAWLGELHLKGKKDWDAYEKSNYIHRRMESLKNDKSHDNSKEQVSAEAGETKAEIETRYNVIELMHKHKEHKIDKYSYYDVVIRSRPAQNKIKGKPDNETIIVNCLKNYPGQAVDFRKKINAVCKNKKISKNFFEKKDDLDEAYDKIDLDIDKVIEKITKFRNWLPEADKKVLKLDKFDPNFNKILFEYDKLFRVSKKHYEKLNKKKNS